MVSFGFAADAADTGVTLAGAIVRLRSNAAAIDAELAAAVLVFPVELLASAAAPSERDVLTVTLSKVLVFNKELV